MVMHEVMDHHNQLQFYEMLTKHKKYIPYPFNLLKKFRN